MFGVCDVLIVRIELFQCRFSLVAALPDAGERLDADEVLARTLQSMYQDEMRPRGRCGSSQAHHPSRRSARVSEPFGSSNGAASAEGAHHLRRLSEPGAILPSAPPVPAHSFDSQFEPYRQQPSYAEAGEHQRPCPPPVSCWLQQQNSAPANLYPNRPGEAQQPPSSAASSEAADATALQPPLDVSRGPVHPAAPRHSLRAASEPPATVTTYGDASSSLGGGSGSSSSSDADLVALAADGIGVGAVRSMAAPLQLSSEFEWPPPDWHPAVVAAAELEDAAAQSGAALRCLSP